MDEGTITRDLMIDLTDILGVSILHGQGHKKIKNIVKKPERQVNKKKKIIRTFKLKDGRVAGLMG